VTVICEERPLHVLWRARFSSAALSVTVSHFQVFTTLFWKGFLKLVKESQWLAPWWDGAVNPVVENKRGSALRIF